MNNHWNMEQHKVYAAELERRAQKEAQAQAAREARTPKQER